ncbi:MAG: hypothetical protein JSR18_04680 [Proteobacteria bacterium]|nr:hypothetical protein [Pseudomonadota bacterium]
MRDLRRVDGVVAVVAAAIALVVVVRALRLVDPYWDTLQYHWPYAARAAGLCDAACLGFPPGIEIRYQAFPLVFHWLFGMLWRIAGTPAAGHLVGIAMLAGLCVWLRARMRVPLAWSWLGFLAVPLVQIHVTSSYADLTANAAIALALLCTLRLALERDAAMGTDTAIAVGALALAAGSKLQLVPVTLVVWAALTVVVLRNLRSAGQRAWPAAAGLVAAALLLVAPQLWLNALHFGNPFYPVEVKVGHWVLPGPETMRQQGMSIGTQWAGKPAWLRWLASVLEYDALRGRDPPWSIDQGDVPFTSAAFRLGGYFAPYVIALWTLVILRARRGDAGRPVAAWLAALSVLCALLPLAHELRYYLFWMLVLVAATLALGFWPRFAAARQPATAMLVRGTVAIAFVSVVLLTGATYLRTAGVKLADLTAPTAPAVAALAPGSTLCIDGTTRDAILYSELFHPAPPHHVRSVLPGAHDGCTQTLTLH